MKWNWQQKDWPQFKWDKTALEKLEIQFLRQSGVFIGATQHFNEEDKTLLTVNMMTGEAVKTSEIEGEYLNRDSVQASLRRNFGLATDNRRIPPAERGIADMMTDLYRNFAKPLSHQTLYNWHKLLTSGRHDLKDIGGYRTHEEPMQIISGPINKPKVHFEAPPSETVKKEMAQFMAWFIETAPDKKKSLPALTRAGIAHLYFVSIHPFEDGNGRIARAISEKSLSECLGNPTLIALSQTIQSHRKDYYKALELDSKKNEITHWLVYFAETILNAQNYSLNMVDFLIKKTKLYDRVRGQLNERQEKAVERLFREGLEGFKGGLSAEKYISITGASRATTTRDLQDLVEKMVLLKVGQLKSTRYHLNIRLRGY
jgi:Fic family protein